MQLFECQSCGNPLYFENTKCERCQHQTGYLPELQVLSAVEPEGSNWVALADPAKRYRFCVNWELHACNWMVDADSATPLCRACQHNRTIPDLSDPARHLLWRRMEEAKRRLIYSLIKLKLPAPSLASGEQEALVFDFLADAPEQKIMTGHEDGIITISLAEADDAAREKLRNSLHEPYRTLLGHFRHEVGHFYWDRLVRDGGQIDSFRTLFGDERADYNEALQNYYKTGAPPNWRENYVSAYATMHPWEDFAETWAHYLHIVDTLEMAYAFHLSVNPRVEEAPSATVDRNPYKAANVATLMQAWLPITFAVNSLNRSMGQPDLYPFVISPPAVAKLQYVQDLIRGTLAKPAQTGSEATPLPARASERRSQSGVRDRLMEGARRLIGLGQRAGASVR
ncbi:MAG: putative zinc-binding peptidase [Hyphomicrobium sp.]